MCHPQIIYIKVPKLPAIYDSGPTCVPLYSCKSKTTSWNYGAHQEISQFGVAKTIKIEFFSGAWNYLLEKNFRWELCAERFTKSGP